MIRISYGVRRRTGTSSVYVHVHTVSYIRHGLIDASVVEAIQYHTVTVSYIQFVRKRFFYQYFYSFMRYF